MEPADLTIPEECTPDIFVHTIRESICDKIEDSTTIELPEHQFSLFMVNKGENLSMPTKLMSANILRSQAAEEEPHSDRAKTTKIEYKFKINSEIKQQLAHIKEVLHQIKSIKHLSTPIKDYSQRKTILLDIDETISCTIPLNAKGLHLNSVRPLPGKMSQYGVIKRPYLDVFLCMIHKYYDIIVIALSDIFICRKRIH
jgi:uncharacterized protein YacL (UPF0231 family)